MMGKLLTKEGKKVLTIIKNNMDKNYIDCKKKGDSVGFSLYHGYSKLISRILREDGGSRR